MDKTTPRDDAMQMGELIRQAEEAAKASGDAATVAALTSLHVFAYSAAERHAELLGLDFGNPADVATLSGGTPKGPPPQNP